MVDDRLLVSVVKFDDPFAHRVVGDVCIRHRNQWIQILEYASDASMLWLTERNIGVNQPLNQKFLEVIFVEALNKGIRNGLLFWI